MNSGTISPHLEDMIDENKEYLRDILFPISPSTEIQSTTTSRLGNAP